MPIPASSTRRAILQLPTVQRIADDSDRTTLLAALVADVCATGGPQCAESLAARLEPREADQIADAVRGSALLGGALANPGALGEASILQLAEHFGSVAAVEAAHEIAAAQLDEDDWRRKELDEIRDRLLTALSHPVAARRFGDARRLPPPRGDPHLGATRRRGP